MKLALHLDLVADQQVGGRPQRADVDHGGVEPARPQGTDEQLGVAREPPRNAAWGGAVPCAASSAPTAPRPARSSARCARWPGQAGLHALRPDCLSASASLTSAWPRQHLAAEDRDSMRRPSRSNKRLAQFSSSAWMLRVSAGWVKNRRRRLGVGAQFGQGDEMPELHQCHDRIFISLSYRILYNNALDFESIGV
jgi:hypothetical protein